MNHNNRCCSRTAINSLLVFQPPLILGLYPMQLCNVEMAESVIGLE